MLALLPVLALFSYGALGVPTDLIVRDTSTDLVARSIVDDFNNFISSVSDKINVDDIKQGILPDFFSNIPDEQEIKDQLGLNDTQIDELPLEVLNIPGYANYTGRGWNLRIHGQAYKQPLSPRTTVSNETLDKAANVFLPDLDIDQLQPHEKDNARNLTSAILSLPQEDVQLVFTLNVAEGQNISGGWNGEIQWGKLTDSRGEIDGFVQLPASANDLPPGNTTTQITRLDIHTNGTDTGNATGYLVPNQGITIISDIDDILRVTKIYQPQEGLLNSFARDFVPWLNMPSIYDTWSTQHPENPYHFHYLTTTPEQATRVYMQFIYHTYPAGSFDTRPLNFTTVDQTFSVRKTLLNKIFETFPQRQFVLVGDTTNNDVMKDYPELVTRFPGQVACILLRNTSATDSGNKFPYDTSGFENLKQEQYMFFNTPDDLTGLDFTRGDCRNNSAQLGTVEFGWQGLPFDISSAISRKGTATVWFALFMTVIAVFW